MISSDWLKTPGKTADSLLNKIYTFFGLARQYAQTYATGFIVFSHLLLAVWVFSPYFLYNYVLLANTDMPDFNIPMFILAKRAIWEGHFNFWNPYLLNGVSSLLSSIAPLYAIINPFYWILFVLPESYLLLAGTFLSFLHLWLIGVVAYFFFVEEIQSKKWAFFAATTYQLCGYTLWWTWTFELVSMWLWFTLALYLIWTAYKRRAYSHYILLSLVLIHLLLPSYPIASINMMVVLGVLTLYRYLSQRQTTSRWHHLLTAGSAFLTSGLIFMMRLLPTWYEASQTSRIESFTLDFRDLSFLGLRLFVPEVFGVNNTSAWDNLLATLPEGAKLDNGFHIHNYFPQFFGVLAALLLVWAIVSSKKSEPVKLWFWLGYVLVSLAAILGLEPIDSVFRILLHPIHLPMGLQVYLPVGVCMLATLAAKTLEESQPDSLITTPRMVFLVLGLIGVLACTLFIWLPQYPDYASLAQAAIVILMILAAFTWLLYLRQPAATSQALSILGYVAVILWSGWCLYTIFLATSPNQTYLSHLKIISVSLLLLSLTYLAIQTGLSHFSTLKIYGAGLILLLIVSFFVTIILYPQVESFRELLSTEWDFYLALLGLTRFIVVSLSFITILRQLQQGRLRQEWLFSLFFLLLIFDLLPTGKVHNFLLSTPFHKASIVFPADQLNVSGPDGLPLELDSKNYRVNRASNMLKLWYWLEINEGRSFPLAATSIYGIRTYDGYYNGVPDHYRQFASNWGTPDVAGYSHAIFTLNSPRFLDLSGVRYDFDPDTQLVNVRPNALSRFMLFTQYEVITNTKRALARLKDREFAPLETVILDKQPKIPFDPSDQPAQKLDFIEHSTDEIELNLTSETPGIVFFNDTYHPDWHVFVNGQEQPLVYADYNFMAVSVPAGESRVLFRYQPRFFYYGVYLAGVGLFLFLVIALTLYIFRNRLEPIYSPTFSVPRTLRQRVPANLKAFRLAYLTFGVLLVVALAQALLNYREVEGFYREYYIVRRDGKYYALPYTVQPGGGKYGNLLSMCYQNGGCTIADSFEEARQFMEQPVEQKVPSLIEEGYRGHNIWHYQHKYYAVPQSPWLFNLLDQETFSICQAGNQCAVADSSEEIKHWLHSLPPLPENKLSSLVKTVATSSPHPTIIGERLFDWYNNQWSEFPQQLDIVFRQPVKVAELEIQLKVTHDKDRPSQQPIVVIAGEDPYNPAYQTGLTLNFTEAENLIRYQLPDPPAKYEHYQIIFPNARGRESPTWLTIENVRLFVLVEEDYKGFNIYWDQDRYYIAARKLGSLHLADINNLNPCYRSHQCGIASSLGEAKQFVDQSPAPQSETLILDQPLEKRAPTLIEEYQGFNIFQDQNKYFALDSPWLFDLGDEKALYACQEQNQCAVADSPEKVKQMVNQLSPGQENDLHGLIKMVATASSSSPALLFDGGFLPENAWQSNPWPLLPQWIDIVFRQPVKLEWLHLQSQVRFSQDQAPQNVVVLAGDDPDNPHYQTSLRFDFTGPGEQISQQLSPPPEKYQWYRIVLLDAKTKDQPEHLAVQEMKLYVLVEEDYNDFNIYWDQDRYYVVAQMLGPVNITNIGNLNECYQSHQCHMVKSLEEAKQWVDSLNNDQ